MQPLPTQITGARFLAERKRAFLWDQPRVGKTGAAILAAKEIDARRVLVVTTASGCGVWKRAFADWWPGCGGWVFGRDWDDGEDYLVDPCILSWGMVDAATACDPLLQHTDWALIILDEDQRATNPGAARSVAVYGQAYDEGARLIVENAIVKPHHRVWHLSGDPAPHDLGNMWMRLRASAPERLLADEAKGWPDVLKFTAFRERYCVVREKMVAGRNIPVVFGGRNEAELKARLEGLYLRRTQADVGIQPPRYDYLPLPLGADQHASMRAIEMSPDAVRVYAALEHETLDDLDMHLGVHRRALGEIKAPLVAQAAEDAFEDGVPKLVIAYWHKSVGDILQKRLSKFGVVRVDGSSSARVREECEAEFRKPVNRVFLAQIEAAGEAIDLSPANELWFCETTFRPKDMHQMALRITNVAAKRNCFVKVCTIDGSLDEAMQRCVMRLWSSIRQVIN